MASTTHHNATEGIMTTTTRCTTDDLEFAITWLATYEGDEEGWESLRRAAEFIGRELEARVAKSAERDWICENVPAGHHLTSEGKETVREWARKVGAECADFRLRHSGNLTNGCFRYEPTK